MSSKESRYFLMGEQLVGLFHQSGVNGVVSIVKDGADGLLLEITPSADPASILREAEGWEGFVELEKGDCLLIENAGSGGRVIL